MLVPNSVSSCEVKSSKNKFFEILTVKVGHKNSMLFSLIYRPPGQHEQGIPLLKTYLDSVNSKFPCSSHILLGDLNFGDINW